MSDKERYAEGQREPAECSKCGQPIWIVYHGPRANHTVERRVLHARPLVDEPDCISDEALRAAAETKPNETGPKPSGEGR